MKKSLIALAVAGAFSAPAFAATENVDVYGRLNMGVSFLSDQWEGVNVPGTYPGSSDMQVTSFASRIGFKGAEDLGNGMSAIWQVESGFDADEGTGTLASRNTFLGLKGGFGTVLAGKHDTPLKLVGRKVDLFGDTFADSRNLLGGGSDTRANNVVAYATPDLGGFGVMVAYTNDPNTTNTSGDQIDDSAYNASVSYENGPLYAALAYGNGDYHENNGLGAHMRLAGAFTMGAFKVVGQYDSLEDDTAAGADYTGWMLGGAFNMGAMTFKANYITSTYDVLGDPEAEQFALGLDYAMSKRTTAYVQYFNASGDFGLNTGFPEIGYGGGASDRIEADWDEVSGFTIGMSHNF